MCRENIIVHIECNEPYRILSHNLKKIRHNYDANWFAVGIIESIWKLLLSRTEPSINDYCTILQYQFRFFKGNDIVEQVQWIVLLIKYSFEEKLYISAVLIDIAPLVKLCTEGCCPKPHTFCHRIYIFFFKITYQIDDLQLKSKTRNPNTVS